MDAETLPIREKARRTGMNFPNPPAGRSMASRTPPAE